jgi:hypothetical protein
MSSGRPAAPHDAQACNGLLAASHSGQSMVIRILTF